GGGGGQGAGGGGPGGARGGARGARGGGGGRARALPARGGRPAVAGRGAGPPGMAVLLRHGTPAATPLTFRLWSLWQRLHSFVGVVTTTTIPRARRGWPAWLSPRAGGRETQPGAGGGGGLARRRGGPPPPPPALHGHPR